MIGRTLAKPDAQTHVSLGRAAGYVKRMREVWNPRNTGKSRKGRLPGWMAAAALSPLREGWIGSPALSIT